MKKSRATIQQMAELYLQGMEPDEIRERFGYKSEDYIIQKLRQARVYVHNRKKVDEGKIKALHRAGWSISEIAEEEQLREPVIREVLNGNKR